MGPVIGGRMEVVAPRRSLKGPDYLRLAILAAVSLGIHLWLISHTAVTARDSLGFARYALRFQSPNITAENVKRKAEEQVTYTPVDVIGSENHPPGYPLAIWLTSKIVRKVADSTDSTLDHPGPFPLPESTLYAAQIVSGLAALLLIVPTYWLGRMLFSRNVGFAAALLFQILPTPARITSDGLSDGLYLLVIASAIVLGVRAVRRPGVGGFLACGFVTGLSYLVRPEGLQVSIAVAIVAAWLGLTRKWPRDLTVGRLAALAVGVGLVATPYMVLIGGVTNKPTGKSLMTPFERVKGKLFGEAEHPAPPVSGPLFASSWHILPESCSARVAFMAVEGTVKEAGKGLHYFAAGLALFGLLALRRRIVSDPGLNVILALAGLNFVLLLGVGITGYYIEGKHTGYVSERHTMLLVMLGCVFAAAALEPLTAALAHIPKIGRLWSGVHAPAWLLLAVVVTALPVTLKPMHAHREGYKHAGQWLVNQVGTDDSLIDPFEWSEWYAWRSLYYIPADPPKKPGSATYAIIDNTKTRPDDHERLPRLNSAINVKNDVRSKVVYQWPENGPQETASVLVYKLIEVPAK